MFIRAPSNSPGIAVITRSLFTFHRGIATRTRRLRLRALIAQTLFVKEFRSAHVLHALNFGIQALFRQSSLDSLMSASLHSSSQRHVADSSQYLRPFASSGQRTMCQATPTFVNVVDRAFQLPSNSGNSSFHVIRPTFIWSLAQAQHTTKFAKFPDAQCLKH